MSEIRPGKRTGALAVQVVLPLVIFALALGLWEACLLYTSDAADE